MSQSNLNETATTHGEGERWIWIYRIGGWAALLSVLVMAVSIAAYFVWPTFPDDIFSVIETSKLAGLISLDFLYLVGNLFGIPLFLALYVTLKRVDDSFAAIALALGFVGLVLLVPARPIWEVMALSEKYAAATTESERALYQAGGEAVLSLFHGTAFQAHYLLGSTSLLISSLMMLRSDIFDRTTAWVGIVTNVLVFGLYIPVIGVWVSILSVLGLAVWSLQIGRRLLRLAGSVSGQGVPSLEDVL